MRLKRSFCNSENRIGSELLQVSEVFHKSWSLTIRLVIKRLPNNLSENAIRPFAVGRKNWLFSNSVEGANASAVVYTMVEMAKAHGLNIYGYLKFLLEHRPGKDMTDEQLAELAPWSEKLQSIKNRM